MYLRNKILAGCAGLLISCCSPNRDVEVSILKSSLDNNYYNRGLT